MYKINFVTEPQNQAWILYKWCKEWIQHISGSTISESADENADANVYINYALFKNKTKCDIAYFTHKEETKEAGSDKFDIIAKQVDWCIAQSTTTLRLLPPGKSSIIKPGIDEQFQLQGRINIGVAGRQYNYTPRKRYEWIDKLEKDPFINEYFRFVFTNGKVHDLLMPSFYADINYLLVTASTEGGPMPLIEALNMGTPVIAPKGVGWCEEYSTLLYDDFDSLKALLKNMITPPSSWKIGATEIVQLVQNHYSL
jgi:hypothetical protein